MRTKTVIVNGKPIFINEYKIKALKEEVLPKLEPAFKALTAGEISEIVDTFGQQLKEVFPELKDIDFDDCYPSEIEAFVEAWIEVNFTGLKRVAGPLLSLAQMGQQSPAFALVKPSGSPIIGKS